MWITRPAVAALLVMMTGLPAMASDIEIATLGRAPLMGSSRDSAELQRNFESPVNQKLLASAGRKLGLTQTEYDSWREQVALGHATWAPIPRHLDKMTWASDGIVHVLQGVHIPAGQMGYRVEVPRQNGPGIYVVYLPAKCGNLSYVLEQPKRLAAQPAFPQPRPLVAAAQNFPAPPAPLVAATGVSGTTPAVSPIPPPPPIPVHHGINLTPLAALLPFLINGGSSQPGTTAGPPPCP